ncbi:Zinc finger, RING-type [Sesbania bispinosa]|nr:Zinc finger, RING-type [Sesbania bispinosa]
MNAQTHWNLSSGHSALSFALWAIASGLILVFCEPFWTKMGSKWKKVKLAIGLNMCIQVPKNHGSFPFVPQLRHHIFRPAFSPSGNASGYRPTTPTPSSSGLRLSKSKSRSSKATCAICLNPMKAGKGHAIFTAECSHSFHFHCITSNVKYGNQICPICRAKWKEVPFQSSISNISHDKSQISRRTSQQSDGWTTLIRRLPSSQVNTGRQNSSLHSIPEPAIFNDDEALDQQTPITHNVNEVDHNTMEIKTYPEVSAVSKSSSHDNFAVLIHLKAPSHSSKQQNNGMNNTESSPPIRAPIDLVTVLDISGSMAARRIFPLQRMTDTGRQQALQAVNSLVPNGGTNIAEGLRKGVKVFVDRRWKNPVGSIILLSDGQDTYTVNNRPGADYRSLVPNSIHRSNGECLQIPVHAFGFGVDHDATSMHSISEISGGTFSFIEAEDVIQDAFAQCIGGLLSVVVQELQVEIQCVHPSLQLSSVKAGNYQTRLINNARMASKGFYIDPITKEMVGLDVSNEVKIQRPDVAREVVVSEVDKQRNRIKATEAMAEARVKAERGDLAAAVSVLEKCHKALSETISAQAGDQLCVALSAELKEMQERMANQRVYEQSGRAYILSGLSSHSWQRATARGDSTDTTSLVHAYQTPSMVDMVSRSQTMIMRTPQSENVLRPAKSFNDRQRRK